MTCTDSMGTMMALPARTCRSAGSQPRPPVTSRQALHRREIEVNSIPCTCRARVVFIALLLLLAMGVSGCAEACPPDEVRAYLEVTERIDEDWMAAESIAESTPRVALSDRIADLEDIRQEWRDVEMPSCAEPYHEAKMDYMAAEIAMLVSFMGEASDSLMTWRDRDVTETFDIAECQLLVLYRDARLVDDVAEELNLTVEDAEERLDDAIAYCEEEGLLGTEEEE